MNPRYSVLTLLVLALSCGETRESHYPDRAAAVSDGAIKRGWLPEWLPRSATNIDEWHDLDTNRTIASFSYAPTDPPILPSECRMLDALRSQAWAEKQVPRARAGSITVFECPEYSETDRAFVLRVGIDREASRAYLVRTAA
jgi:hypothetical protein